jgi:hypothetical protein
LEDVDCCICIPERRFIDATTRNTIIPEFVHRVARKYSSEEGLDAIEKSKDDEKATGLPHWRIDGDAEILKQYRNFRQGEAEVVHHDTGEESLRIR